MRWRVWAALFLFVGFAAAEETTVVLLHTADIHGRILHQSPAPDAEPGEGGWLRTATRIREIRDETEHVLLVDAGDTIQGSPESHATRGREMAAALERLNYDAWAIGNHEFDWGWDSLRELLAGTTLTALGANIILPDTDSKPPPILPYTVRTLDGIRVLIVGLTTPGIPNWFVPDLLEPVRVDCSVSTLRDLMPALRSENADIWILVTHQGNRGGGVHHASQGGLILRQFPEFDVVIGGHSHEFVPGQLVNGVLYAQAGCHGHALGRVDLVYNRTERRVVRKTGRLLPIGLDVPPDPKESDAWRERIEETRARLSEPVGRLATPLSATGARPGHAGTERLLRAAIGEAVEADVVIHGVLCGAHLEAGVVTEGDIWRVVPYENFIGIAHLNRDEIRAILEEVLAQPRSPRFMGISGLRVDVDPEAPAGKRVRRIRLADGRRAHVRKRYRVAFNSYTLASAGGRFPQLREIALGRLARFTLTDIDTRDALRTFLARNPDLDLSAPAPDGYRFPGDTDGER